MSPLLVLVLALAACNREEKSYLDEDDDDAFAYEDCDDHDPDVGPEEYERCNGVDDDCDGEIDEGLATHDWYTDADSDGYGADGTLTQSCFQPLGTSADASDCDDDDGEIHPGAIEECNGADDDCNGVTDDRDEDHDDFISVECGGDDCDDEDSRVNPDARERFYDGEDRDCDGWSDFDADKDGYDSETEAGGGDCDDTDEEINPGAEEVCNDDIDNNCDGSSSGCSLDGEVGSADADAVLLGAAGELAGWLYPSVPGDLDKDGAADLIVGAPGAGAAAEDAGAAFVVRGPINGTRYLVDADARLDGVAADDQAGQGAALVGDTNDDDYPDLAVAAPGEDTAGTNAGAVYVVLGPVTGQRSLADADGVLYGDDAYDRLGGVTSAGDLTADDQADLLVMAPDDDTGERSAGAVYVVLGPFTGSASIADSAYLTAVGSTATDALGSAACPALDSDGDGVDDFAISAPRSDGGGDTRGTVYLVAWPDPGVQTADEAAQLRFMGGSDGDELGTALSTAGDVDDDGYPDLLVGAPNVDGVGADSGVAYLFPGGWRVGVELPSSATATLMGVAEGDGAGEVVAGPGDINGDEVPDLLVAAPDADGVGTSSGAVYVVYGPVLGSVSLSDADATILGEAAQDNLGAHGLARVGDLYDDGVADLALGIQLNDVAGANAGAVWIYNGQGR